MRSYERKRDQQTGHPRKANSTNLGQVLVIHAFEEHILLERVHRDVYILIPYRIEVIADNFRPRLGCILDQHTKVRVALPAKSTLHVLDIHGLLDEHAHDTNRRPVLRSTTQRASHVERLPLGRHANTTRFASREGPPVPHALPWARLLRLEQIVQVDGQVPDHWVFTEIAVVDDLDGDRARVPILAEELLR